MDHQGSLGAQSGSAKHHFVQSCFTNDDCSWGKQGSPRIILVAIWNHQETFWGHSWVTKDYSWGDLTSPRIILDAIMTKDLCVCAFLYHQGSFMGQSGTTRDHFGRNLESPRIILGAKVSKGNFQSKEFQAKDPKPKIPNQR
jgi:hypothetical protein